VKPYQTFSGITIPLDRANVDTDAIIPKQFLKSIKKTGFGNNLFDEWRYLDHGEPGEEGKSRAINQDFVLNFPRYQSAEILLARDNFGCGSSREHAVWALRDYGIRAVIAPSFADIFYNNCFKNGLLPITLEKDQVQKLFSETNLNEGYIVTVNLLEQMVILANQESFIFKIDPGRKHRLLNGLDDIDLTLQFSGEIETYENKAKSQYPWLFQDIN
jgi:3-isopropylmalate/(R)-2-methylmalate dehydratase small subunit